MSNILVLNLGSTSFKYALFDENFKELKRDNLKLDTGGNIKDQIEKNLREVLRQIGDISQLKAIGHRVVHGGNNFSKPVFISKENIKDLKKLNSLAPLHNPFNLAGIQACLKYLPAVQNYAVFDTAFFADLPQSSQVYAIPYKFYKEFNIRRYGFHGISHHYAAQEAAKKINIDYKKAKIITLHLGGGCSVTAINKGKPIDTSMGFTPLEGLVMQTRSGSIDPGLIFELAKYYKQDYNQIYQLLNYQSGLLGLSGHSDYLEFLKDVRFGEPKSKLAFDIFINSVKKYIGAYLALLGKVDVIVFTGKIGAGKSLTRNKICDTTLLKQIKTISIEPNEELAIAKQNSII